MDRNSIIGERKQLCGLIPFGWAVNDSATSQIAMFLSLAKKIKVDWKKHEMLSVIIREPKWC